MFKKNLKYESILYNSTELPIERTSRESQKQTILLIFISRKIQFSVYHNTEVTASISYMFLAK